MTSCASRSLGLVTLSLGLQFVPLIHTIYSLGLDSVNRGNVLQSEKTSCVNGGNTLQSETTSWVSRVKKLLIHDNRFPIRWNGLHNLS